MKKNIIYAICVVAFLTSCSSAYRSSQTPDDVYYSPGQKQYTANADRYESYASSSDDDYLRMKAADYNRWSDLDDYSYWNDSRYYYNNYCSPYSSYTGWNSLLGFGSGFYNPYVALWINPWTSGYYPYYTVIYYKNPTAYYSTGASRSGLSTFNNHTYNNYNIPLQNGNRSGAYSNNNLSSRNSNYYINQTRSNNNSNPVRTFNNNNNSSNFNSGSRSNISSGSSGGGGRVRGPRG